MRLRVGDYEGGNTHTSQLIGVRAPARLHRVFEDLSAPDDCSSRMTASGVPPPVSLLGPMSLEPQRFGQMHSRPAFWRWVSSSRARSCREGEVLLLWPGSERRPECANRMWAEGLKIETRRVNRQLEACATELRKH